MLSNCDRVLASLVNDCKSHLPPRLVAISTAYDLSSGSVRNAAIPPATREDQVKNRQIESWRIAGFGARQTNG